MLEQRTNLTFRTQQRCLCHQDLIESTDLNTAIVSQEGQWYLFAAASCNLEDRNSEPPFLFMMLKVNERARYMNLRLEQRTNLTFRTQQR